MLKKPQKIIIIDDEPEYANELKETAKKHRLLADCFNNLNDGIEALENNIAYKYVILDDKCYINNSMEGEPKFSFVLKAWQEIEDVMHEHNRIVDFCINAYECNGIASMFEDTAHVFTKKDTPSRDAMFRHIVSEIKTQALTTIEEEFPEPLEFTRNYLSQTELTMFYAIAIDMKKNDAASRISCLALLRRFEEVVFDQVFENLQKQNKITWQQDLEQGRSRTKNIIDLLYKNRLIPHFIKNEAYALYSSCSKYGNHATWGKHQSLTLPSNYFVRSLVYSLFGILEYFNQADWNQTF